MIEIKGKVNTAICYATVVEGEAIEPAAASCFSMLRSDFLISQQDLKYGSCPMYMPERAARSAPQ